jgi:nanoRNase/pAp phosphatase (c-di-AMP/oligoRNAs hydrolase)
MNDFRDLDWISTDDAIELGAALNAEFDRDLDTLEKRAYLMLVVNEVGEVLSGLAVNATAKYASELGNRLAKKSAFGCVYSYDGSRKEWQYSLRSTNEGPDVSSIAKRHGGGGHRNAAGFAGKDAPDFEGWVW